MKTAAIIIIALIGLFDIALVVACHHMEDRDTYEAYERWKNDRDRGLD